MKSVALCCFVVAFLCFATPGSTQELTQEELENLRNYLQRREAVPPAAPSVLDSQQLDTYGASRTQQLLDQAVAEQTRSVDDVADSYQDGGSEISALERDVNDDTLMLDQEQTRSVDDVADSYQDGGSEISALERDVNDEMLMLDQDVAEQTRSVDDVADSYQDGGSEISALERDVNDEMLFSEQATDDQQEPQSRGTEDVDGDQTAQEQRWLGYRQWYRAGGRGRGRGRTRPAVNNTVLYKTQVVKAEQFRYGSNRPFYIDTGVVVTLQDERRLLIRKTGYAFRGSISSRPSFWRRRCTRCNYISIISADDMTRSWELVGTSKTVTQSTVGDYVKASSAAVTRKDAAVAMMKLQ